VSPPYHSDATRPTDPHSVGGVFKITPVHDGYRASTNQIRHVYRFVSALPWKQTDVAKAGESTPESESVNLEYYPQENV
jgi:hypothetical protein